MTDIRIDQQCKIKANLVLGGPVTNHQWKIDGILQSSTTDTLIINPYQLTLGGHAIIYKGTNYCGKYIELIENIIVIEVNKMEQTDPITVNQPVQTVVVTLRKKSDLTVTVMDDPNATNAPVAGATVEVVGTTISGITDAFGKALLAKVPFGVQMLKTTYT